MTLIAPFPGIRYNLSPLERLAEIISPPYDKISTDERKELWKRHPQNVVRLILPPPSDSDIDVATQSTDGESANWYASAAETFNAWRKDGLLATDVPRFYIYQQTFSYWGTSYRRMGLFAALQLEEQGGPLAHEFTFEGPKADRLRLMNAAKANLSPIFLLGDGDSREWSHLADQSDELLLDFEDLDGQRHELSAIQQPEKINAVRRFFEERTLVIADGHHRYETAQNYKRKMIQETGLKPEDHPWGFVMALIVPVNNPGLLVLPNHRVLSQLPENWAQRLQEKAKLYGEITALTERNGTALRALLAEPANSEAVAVVSAEHGFLFRPNAYRTPPSILALAEPLRKLNVSILHHFIFDECLGMTPADLQSVTRYIRGEEEAVSLVQSGKAQAAFLISAIPPKTVFEVSQHHVKMPQKSTDFYPKIPTGLLLRSVED